MEKKQMINVPVRKLYLEVIRDVNLTREQLGDLFLAMLEYRLEGKEPEGLDPVCRAFWVCIREEWKRRR